MAFVRVEGGFEVDAPPYRRAAARPMSAMASDRFDATVAHSRAGLATIVVHALLGWALVARLGAPATPSEPSAGPITFIQAISEAHGSKAAQAKPTPAAAQPRPLPKTEHATSEPVASEPPEWSAVDLPPAPTVAAAAPPAAGGRVIGFDPYASASYFGTSRGGMAGQGDARQAFPLCEAPFVLDRQVLAAVADAGGEAARSPDAPAIGVVVGRGGIVLSVEIDDASRPAAYAHLLVGRRLAQNLAGDQYPCRIKVPPIAQQSD